MKKNSCWSQLWISMVSEWFPDVVTICYIFNVTPNIHACWIMLSHVDKLHVKHILFLFLRVFLCNPCGAQASVGNIHEVSMTHDMIIPIWPQLPKSCWCVELWFQHRGMPNADSGVGVATKMFSKSSRKHVEQSKSKGQKSRRNEIRKCVLPNSSHLTRNHLEIKHLCFLCFNTSLVTVLHIFQNQTVSSISATLDSNEPDYHTNHHGCSI